MDTRRNEIEKEREGTVVNGRSTESNEVERNPADSNETEQFSESFKIRNQMKEIELEFQNADRQAGKLGEDLVELDKRLGELNKERAAEGLSEEQAKEITNSIQDVTFQVRETYKLGNHWANKANELRRKWSILKKQAVAAEFQDSLAEISDPAKAPKLNVGDVFTIEGIPFSVTKVSPRIVVRSLVPNPQDTIRARLNRERKDKQ